MEPGQSRALEDGWEHFTQKSIVLGVEDNRLVEMEHVIVRIGRSVVHGEGRYREAVGRIIIQNMLTEGRGEHVLWSSEGGGEKNLWAGSHPEEGGWYMDGIGGAAPRVVRAHIHELALTGVGPCWLFSVPGVAGYRWIGWVNEGAFFWIGLLRRSRMVNAVGTESCRKITHHPSVGQCRRVHRPPCLCRRDGGSGRGGPRDFSAWLASNRVCRRSLSSLNRFACSRNSATCLACSSCLASIS